MFFFIFLIIGALYIGTCTDIIIVIIITIIYSVPHLTQRGVDYKKKRISLLNHLLHTVHDNVTLYAYVARFLKIYFARIRVYR